MQAVAVAEITSDNDYWQWAEGDGDDGAAAHVLTLNTFTAQIQKRINRC